MLISKERAERWYQKDSFYYRNFALLFKNKLWTRSKGVPQGFAICPYFWMAQFSFWVFKPLFYWPICTLGWLGSLIAKPCTGLDSKCTLLLKKLGLPEPIQNMGFAAMIIAGGSLYLVGGLVFGWLHLLQMFSVTTPTLTTFWAAHLLAALYVFRFIMAIKAPCGFCAKYGFAFVLAFLLGLVMVAAVVAPGTWTVILNGILVVLGAIWTGIAGPFGWLGSVCWQGIEWLGQYIYTFRVPTLFILAGLLAFGVIGLVADRLLPEEKRGSYTYTKPEPDYTNEWLNWLTMVMLDELDYFWQKVFAHERFNDYRLSDGRVVPSLKRFYARTVLETILLEEDMELFRTTKPKDLYRRGKPSNIQEVGLMCGYLGSWYLSLDRIERAILDLDSNELMTRGVVPAKAGTKSGKTMRLIDYVFSKLDPILDRLAEEILYEERRMEKEKKSKKFWEHIHNCMHKILTPVSSGCNKLSSQTTRLIKGVSEALHMAFKLLKKGKSEVCPYFPFTEPPTKESDDNESK
jgi:hypothetical protein